MKISPLLLILLLITVLTATVSAEEAVFISTDSADYSFSADEESQIPVKITNSLGKDIPGTLVLKVKDPKTGEYASSQRKQVTAFSGEETYYVSAGNSGGERDLLIDISFEYGNSPVYSSELNGIGISFSSSPAEDDEGSLIDSEPVKGTSEIKADSQDKPSYSPKDSSGKISTDEDYSDPSALKKTLLEEEIEKEFRKNALVRAVSNSTILQGINSSLHKQNFTKISSAVNPKGKNSGYFYSAYMNSNDETVSVSGTVDEGEVKNILEETNTTIILPQEFRKNTTLTGIISDIEPEGFERSDTRINISFYSGSSAVHSELKLTYRTGIYSAEICSASENGTVTSVSLEKDDIIPFWVLPALILIFTSANAIAVCVYYSVITRDTGSTKRETPAPNSPPRKEPDLLKNAEMLFIQGHKKEAVCMAVRALRVNISYELSAGEELSDRECSEYLLSGGRTINDTVIRIIKSTEKQRFSEEEITGKEFKKLLEEIKSVI